MDFSTLSTFLPIFLFTFLLYFPPALFHLFLSQLSLHFSHHFITVSPLQFFSTSSLYFCPLLFHLLLSQIFNCTIALIFLSIIYLSTSTFYFLSLLSQYISSLPLSTSLFYFSPLPFSTLSPPFKLLYLFNTYTYLYKC